MNEYLSNVDRDYAVEDLISGFLINTVAKTWRTMAISYLSRNKLIHQSSFKGLDTFKDAIELGKGVVLVNSHYGQAESAITIFPQLGYNDFHTIVREKGTTSKKFMGLNPRYTPNLIIFKDHSNAELVKQLFKAKEILNGGGIFHILGDGYHGKSVITHDFLGRIRGFRASYAELGLSTGAPIVPVFITVDAAGQITVDIKEPLDKGNDSMPHNERIQLITRQYVDHLQEKWINGPQYIYWGFIEKYLRQLHA
jgi:lauroyl/myristoyl acyltransferase